MADALTSPFDIVIGKTLRDIRESQGMSQQEVAEFLHTTQTIVSLTESGKRGIKLVEVMMCSVCLNVTPRQLFERIKYALHDEGLI